MSIYRISRNLEASLIDFLNEKLSENEWKDVTVIKGFSRAYKQKLPVIAIRLSDTTHNKIQIGDNSTYRTPLILIDIFCKSDGQRLDLKDCLINELRNGFPYYKYTIENGKVKQKELISRVGINTIDDSPVDFDVDKQNLDPRDRYRHLLSLNCRLGKIEG